MELVPTCKSRLNPNLSRGKLVCCAAEHPVLRLEERNLDWTKACIRTTVVSHCSSMQRSVRRGRPSGRRLGLLSRALDLHSFKAFRSFASVYTTWGQSLLFERKVCQRGVYAVLCSARERSTIGMGRGAVQADLSLQNPQKAEITEQGMSTMMACHHCPPFLESQLLPVRLRSHLRVQPAPWWCSRMKE